jgi:hypothetical protein
MGEETRNQTWQLNIRRVGEFARDDGIGSPEAFTGLSLIQGKCGAGGWIP